MFDTILGGLKDALMFIPNKILGGIGDKIAEALSNFIGKLLYYVDIAFCYWTNIFYRIFAVLAGYENVKYDGKEMSLTRVFFSNVTINRIYWGMAVLAFVMLGGFAILAVVRKMLDVYDKHQESLGAVLWNTFKAMLLIFSINFIFAQSMEICNVLMSEMLSVFDGINSYSVTQTITFTEEDFARMNNILETIGNYSVNPSYNSRFNMNSCFNAVREELKTLQDDDVFSVDYYVYRNGEEVETWQSMLKELACAAPLTQDLSMDVYNEAVVISLTEIMNKLKSGYQFEALESYTQTMKAADLQSDNTPLGVDVVLFMSGCSNAAKNSYYNQNASIDDGLRLPYVRRTKSIYSLSDVSGDFNISLGGIQHLIIIVLAALTSMQLMSMCLLAVIRIFQLLVLYVTAPFYISTMPFDNGDKFKQWSAALVVQLFGIFGNVIPMRLMILFVPIITSSKLVLVSSGGGSGLINLLGKAALIVGGFFACRMSSEMISSILIGNGGFGSMRAAGSAREMDSFLSKYGISALGNPLGAFTKAGGFKFTGGIVKGGGELAAAGGRAAASGLGFLMNRGDSKNSEGESGGEGGGNGGSGGSGGSSPNQSGGGRPGGMNFGANRGSSLSGGGQNQGSGGNGNPGNNQLGQNLGANGGNNLAGGAPNQGNGNPGNNQPGVNNNGGGQPGRNLGANGGNNLAGGEPNQGNGNPGNNQPGVNNNGGGQPGRNLGVNGGNNQGGRPGSQQNMRSMRYDNIPPRE